MLLQGSDLYIKNQQGNMIIAAAKSLELTINCEMIEVARQTVTSWRDYITGRKDWSVSVSSLVTADSFTASVSMIGQTFGLYFHDGPTAESSLLHGSAVCTQAKITEQKGSVAKGSFVFSGVGALS